ncbi:hypothetical protein CY35_12G038100 [Sphagnum magellanicum]|nr:hypothetical protein CY35_12G038100 [Sphagnum magellanicum]
MALLGQSHHACTLFRGEFFMGSLRSVSVSSLSSPSCTLQSPLTPPAPALPPNCLIASSSSPSTKGSTRKWPLTGVVCYCSKDDYYASRVLRSQLGDPQKHGRRRRKQEEEPLVVVRASSSSEVNTFGYVIAYSTILFIRCQAGIVTKEMLALPKLQFIALGALEALGIASGMAAAANIAGASIPILHQLFLVWQLLLSATILRKRYARGQILGCLLVILGVLVVVTSRVDRVNPHSLQQSSLIWPLIMIFSTACTAGASILKEFIFQDAAKRLQGGTVDIFVVNSLGSSFQALFVLLLLPLLSNLKGIPFQQLPTYLWEGKGLLVYNPCLDRVLAILGGFKMSGLQIK